MKRNLLFIDDESEILENYKAFFEEHMDRERRQTTELTNQTEHKDNFFVYTSLSGEGGLSLVRKKKEEGVRAIDLFYVPLLTFPHRVIPGVFSDTELR